MGFARWLILIRNNMFAMAEKVEKLICFPYELFLVICAAGGKAADSAVRVTSATFVFISSRPTVATVLVGALLFLSSFRGLSRRCSRCLITWFHPRTSNIGRKEQKK